MDSRFSLAPFGEPGNVMISDLFLTPATGLDIIATGWRSDHCISWSIGKHSCDTEKSENTTYRG